MGFLDSILGSLVDSSKNFQREKYENMELEELKREWNEKFCNRSYQEVKYWNANSPMAILDDVYAVRCYKTSWYEKATKALKMEEQRKKEEVERKIKEQERQEREERERLEQLQRENDFRKILEQSEMASRIIEIINEEEYKVTQIDVEASKVRLCDDDGSEIKNVIYKRYGYPDLDNYQIQILTEFLQNNLTL